MKIAVLAGNGIGPEVVGEAVNVLQALMGSHNTLELTEAPTGAAAIEATGIAPPPATRELAGKAEAILFGSVGGPLDEDPDRSKRRCTALLRLRHELSLFASSALPSCSPS